MLKIKLRASAERIPGQGELLIEGWQQDTNALQLAIQRNQDDYYLDDAQNWHASKRWNPLPAAREEDGKLLIPAGPWLVDPLTADTRMSYMLYLQNAQGSDKGVLRIVGELLSSGAQGNFAPAPAPDKVEPESAPEAESVVKEELPPPEPIEPPEPPAPLLKPAPVKKSRWLPWLIALLFALLVAALAWWLMQRFMQSPLEDPQESPPDAASGKTGACSEQVLSENSDDLALIQNCLKTSPASDQVLALISAAKQAKRCNLMQRLYAHKAQSGDVSIALAYAREYDPASFTAGGCIESADRETAAYWYELALERDPNQSAARERLEALKP